METSPSPIQQPINQPGPVSSIWPYVLGVVLLMVGLLVGYFLSTFWTKPENTTASKTSTEQTLNLPNDAVLIQECSNKKGALYVLPKDIPIGPVYMVNSGKVIGLEYMLSKDEFLSGKSFTDLESKGIKVDHVNIGLLSQGHSGYQLPHYHVDLYIVNKATSEAISCPTAATTSATTK